VKERDVITFLSTERYNNNLLKCNTDHFVEISSNPAQIAFRASWRVFGVEGVSTACAGSNLVPAEKEA
jgi:hypothetical protein